MFIHKVNETTAFKIPEERDAATLLEIVENNRTEFGQWLPWVKDMYSADDEQAFIKNGRQRMLPVLSGLRPSCIVITLLACLICIKSARNIIAVKLATGWPAAAKERAL
ncbi:hypothetical protein [Lentilactobacillus farraginis]|uniref:Ribosomal-protein-L7p-serine acetyltransferase n=1 Tax=Lentilactobacillus farraginis DSM 18382 = JCM 14108 TaxID=1423743 RepID=X0PLD2_9LACO|nr:hypothetical protein [Lentilactobacillus farraginis]GAF37536.1 hypothetical protein JCM14108_2576 [Lentilactobacillus farraginis DSM 18382 = JCM 14108]